MRILTAIVLATALLSPVAGPATEYRVEQLVPDTPLHGANGMHFAADGKLIGGSMMGGTIFSLDTQTGALETLVPSPLGIADDLAIGPDGQIVWTSMPMGIVHGYRPGEKVRKLATGLRLINSIYFNPEGRLFAAQVTEDLGNLYEIDPAGELPPRVVIADLAGLNGFEITADNILYGPLMNAGKVIRIDLDTLEITDVADGFTQPVAVNLDSHGYLYVIDIVTGELTRIDPDNGKQRLIAQLTPPIDNIVISEDDLIYVSAPCHNGIQEINPETGAVRQIAAGSIGLPGAGVITRHNGRETLVIPGMFCQNLIDTETGEVTLLPRRGKVIWSSWLDWRNDVIVLSSFAFGQLQWLDAVTGEPFRTLPGFENPYAVRIMDDGSVLVAEYGSGRILRLTEPFDGTSEVVADGLEGPLGFTLTDSNRLIVTEAAGGRITAIDLDDGSRTLIRDGLDQPEGIAMRADGRLIVAEVGRRRIIAIDPQSAELDVIADHLPIGMPPIMGPPKTFLPTGVLVGNGGIIYITTDIDHNVLKITPVD